MAGNIPKEFIEDLVARSDIVDIIDSRVRLKKAGRNYQACCPFHNEKTPSFTVSPEKQFYYCFGCGAKGNAIGFLMEYDRLDFVEAVEELASINGVEVPREKSKKTDSSYKSKAQRQSDYDLMTSVAKFYQSSLKKDINSAKVIEYLKGRGLSGEVVKYWGIGYAPDAWDSLIKHFGNGELQKQQLTSLKLINQNDQNKLYDFFRHRVMFPIIDKRGKTIAFGGRIIEGKGPKYLNSPETAIFNKGSELYGLFQAKKENRHLDRLIVVEGYMDVVALSQYGITNAVAALGTATTLEHMQLLFRSTTEVICCYDGDNAGKTAAWRALENALPALKDGVILKFLFLPDGEDPDSMIRKEGKEAFENRLKNATPMSKFFFAKMLDRHSLSSIESKASLKAEAEPLIKKIVGDNQRNMLMKELSQLCGESELYEAIQQTKKSNRYKTSRKEEFSDIKVTLSPIRQMLRILLENPGIANRFPQVQPQALKNMQIRGIEMLIEVHAYCNEKPKSTTAMLLENFRSHEKGSHLYKLMDSEITDSFDQESVYVDSFRSLLKQFLDQRLDTLHLIEKNTGLSEAQQQELLHLLSQKASI